MLFVFFHRLVPLEDHSIVLSFQLLGVMFRQGGPHHRHRAQGVGQADSLTLLDVVATLLELLQVALGSSNGELLRNQVVLGVTLSDVDDVTPATAPTAALLEKYSWDKSAERLLQILEK